MNLGPVTVGPNTTISAPDSVTAGTVGLTAMVPVQAGASYAWTLTGGSILGSADASKVTFNAGAAGTLLLQCTVTLPDGGSATGQKVILVSQGSFYAYYSFDEGQGNLLLDRSGHGFTGFLRNNPTWAAGKVGSGMAFDGASSHVDIPFTSPFSAPFSISFWVNLGAINRGVDNPILWFGTTRTDCGLGIYERGGHFVFDFFQDSLTSQVLLIPNIWYHVMVTYDGTKRSIYINGNLDAAQVLNPYIGTGNLLTLGQWPWSTTNTLLGSLDELKVFSSCLSQTDAASLFTHAINVQISPRGKTLATGQSLNLSATVTGTANTDVIWALPDSNSGTITPAGVYTAPNNVPAQGGQFHVVATSQADPAQSDAVVMTINRPILILPQTVTLPGNGIATFQATTTNQPNGNVVWSVQESNGGTISSAGLYQAPAFAGTYHVVATYSTTPSTPSVATVTVIDALPSGLDLGLVGRWNFDSSANPSADITGNGNDGTFCNAPGLAPGKVGNALVLNGSSFLALPTVNCFTGPFSISAWFKVSQVNRGIDNVIFSHGIASASAGLLVSEREGKPYFSFYSNDLLGINSLSANEWTHIVATYDGFKKCIYINGSLDSTQTSSPYLAFDANAHVGKCPWGAQPGCLGSIDEVRVYRRALSPVEVASLYASTVNVKISPSQASLAAGATQTFTVQVSDPANMGVTWSLSDEESCGTLTSSGLYTAPASVDRQGLLVQVHATSVSDPSQSDTATVMVQPAVRVIPAGATMTPGASLALSTINPAGAAFTSSWSIQESGGGTLSLNSASSVNYTAPATPGTYHVLASNQGYSAVATLTVANSNAGPLLSFLLDENCGAKVFDNAGSVDGVANLSGSPSWVPGYSGSALCFTSTNAAASLVSMLDLPSSWTLSAWVQTPLPTTNAAHVLAGGPSGSDCFALVNADQNRLGCLPASGTFLDSGFKMNTLRPGWHFMAVVGSGGQTTFYVDGVKAGNSIAWQSTAPLAEFGNGPSLSTPFGTIDEFKAYGWAQGAGDLASEFALGRISLSPANASLAQGGSITFTAQTTGLSPNTIVWSVQEAQGGAITSDGVYTAPAQGGIFHIQATSTANPVVQTTATISVGLAALAPDLYFPFSEGSGTMVHDASGFQANLGTLVNGPTWVAGNFGSALNFQSAQRIILQTPFQMGNAWTLSAWIKTPLPVTHTYHSLARAQNASTGDTYIITNSDESSLGLWQSSPTSKFWDSGFKLSTLSAGWHHVAAVGQGGTTQFYVDGVAASNLIAYQPTSDIFSLGNSGQDGSPYGFGTCDEFRIYRRALGPPDVMSLAQQGLAISPSGPVLGPGATAAFTAIVPGDATNAVSWSLPVANSGNITAAGVYTAPTSFTPSVQAIPVVAQSSKFPSLVGTSSVRLANPARGLVAAWMFRGFRLSCGSGSPLQPA